MNDLAGITYADYSSSFSFSVNMTTGAITNGKMQGGSPNLAAAGNGLTYSLTGGSGTMSGGNFHIDGYGGTVMYPVNPAPGTAMAQPTSDPNTYMDGSGNIDNVGGGVSGTFQIDGTAGTGWTVDGGTFTGSRVN